MGEGIWNGRGYLEKNSTAMNENSGVLKNSCDRIYSYEWCYSRNTIIHEWNLGEGCQTFEGNSGI